MATRTDPVDQPGGSSISQAGELRSTRIEALRGVAALLVLEGHVFGWSRHYEPHAIYGSFAARTLLGGGFGVFLFFALSGYLLYWPFARRDFADGGAVDLGRYTRNRALRILPLYYVVVVAVLVLQERFGTFEQWWRMLLFAQSFSNQTVGRIDGPMWSLVVELHFYALLPLLAWALARVSARSPARGAGALVVLGLASLATAELTRRHGLTWRYSLPVTFVYFVGGMLVAVIRAAGRDRLLRLPGALRSADAWLVAAAALWVGVFWNYRLEALMAVAGLLVVGACVLPLRPSALFRILDTRALAIVGVASYSLYLWHLPLVEALARRTWLPHGYWVLLAAATVLSLTVAAISYLAVEAPFLRLRRRWASSSPAPTVESSGG
jgi:peptidoglycan/LPS O-acetylase OafA/YrhL